MQCLICLCEFKALVSHLRHKHDMRVSQYKEKFNIVDAEPLREECYFPHFGPQLLKIRLDRGLSQKELSHKSGIERVQIHNFEKNHHKPSYESIISLAKTLNVSSDYLLGLSDAANTYKIAGFKNEEKLTDKNRQLIQEIINLMIK